MSSSDLILWLANGYAAVMIVVGFWFVHQAKTLDRRVEEAEARAARGVPPAE